MIESQRTLGSSQQHFGKTYGGAAPENYERYFIPAIGAPFAADLIESAGLRAGDCVLDVACGTGIVARLAAPPVAPTGRVTGLDLNPEMLAVAARVAPPEMAIDWREANAEAIPLSDEVFDVVFCQFGLQFVPDKLKALREMRRVLAPDGRLAIDLPGPTPEAFTIIDDALARHIGPDAAGFVRAVFSLHDTGEIRNLLDTAGFREIAVREITKTVHAPSAADFLWGYIHSTPLAGIVAQASDESRALLERDVVKASERFVSSRGLSFEQGVVVATATK
jgi:ubiquinone/menaquinone biosynthesis C-methylase UbiE